MLVSGDGERIDCYLGHASDSDLVFIINQLFDDGSFDEHKVMLDFASADHALRAYLCHMPAGWTRFDPIKTLTVAEFKHWLQAKDTTKKLAHRKVAAPPRVSFQAWLKSLGGWSGLEKVFGQDWMDPYYESAGEHCGGFPAGSAKQKKCWEETARELAEGDMANALADWQYKYEAHLQFPLKLYRAVTLQDRNALNTEGIGIYWTDSESHAQAHWGHGGGHVYVISAEIDEDAIDWPGTLIANMAPSTGEDEQEIRLKAGAHIRLTGFRKKQFGWGENEPWKPLEAEAVA